MSTALDQRVATNGNKDTSARLPGAPNIRVATGACEAQHLKAKREPKLPFCGLP